MISNPADKPWSRPRQSDRSPTRAGILASWKRRSRSTADARLAVMMLTLVAVLAAPAAAQELSVGYQVQRFSSNGDASTVPLGVSASLAGPASGPVGVVGHVDWSRKRESESVRPGYDA